MYFAIAGKNLNLSKYELSLVGKIIAQEGRIFFFETENFKKCKNLAGFVKIGKVISIDEFKQIPKSLIGANIHLKPADKSLYNFKRYKQIDLLKTDLEIKNKGIEVIFFKSMKDKVGIIKFYQNINLYETIDFSKPVRSMNIGMMPSKLTHLMLNFVTGLNYNQTIYDPFAGLGTTLMISNYFGNNVIGSDLNISPAKQNWKWFEKKQFYKYNFKAFLFKQDVTEKFKTKLVNYSDFVVTEGYLGPVVNRFLDFSEAEKLEQSFNEIYIKGIKNLLTLEKLQKIVITFPAYKLKRKVFYTFNKTYEIISKFANLEKLDELYNRLNQKVAREIVLITKK